MSEERRTEEHWNEIENSVHTTRGVIHQHHISTTSGKNIFKTDVDVRAMKMAKVGSRMGVDWLYIGTELTKHYR
jgi:hypothetical protein